MEIYIGNDENEDVRTNSENAVNIASQNSVNESSTASKSQREEDDDTRNENNKKSKTEPKF